MSETIISEIREYLLGRFTMHADDMVRRLDMYVTENTAELAQLRTALDEARKVIECYANKSGSRIARTYLEAHPEEKK